MSDNILYGTDNRSRFANLLDRYPDIHPDERSDLLAFLTNGALVDRGMIRGDTSLAPIIEQVERDHPDHFRTSVGSNIMVAILLIAPLLLMCWFAVYWTAK
jgi:hypothetical protein